MVLLGCRLAVYIDFVVCVGGDGVILHASYLFKRAIPPVSSSACTVLHLVKLIPCPVLLGIPSICSELHANLLSELAW